MDFGKAFSYPFEDPDWMKKVGIAAVVMLIPLVGAFMVTGWGVEITRRVIRRDPRPLPEWTDFGAYLVDGLKVMVIGLVYMLPIILLMGCPGILFVVAGSQDDPTTMANIAGAVTACLSCLVIIYAVLVSLLMPAAIGKFAATGELGAAFRFGEIISVVRAKPAVYVMVMLGVFVSGMIGGAGGIVCGIGALFTTAYSTAINGYLWGQAYLESGQNQAYSPTMQM